ncbi:MAG: hypothetical protein CL867_10170 [Cytophagaceae bacterium]|nr:hypothetical protein [Cytophagaceae bacterium]
MKRYLYKLFFFLLTLYVLSYASVWIYEIPKREAVANKTLDVQNKWNDIKDSHAAFDIIILGSSRGDSGYNPAIIDSITGLNAYNLCSGSQNIVETYYIIKELIKYQQPKIIVLDHFLPSFKDEPDYFQVLANAEQMSFGGRMDMVVNGFGATGLLNYSTPILKYKSYFKNDLKNSLNKEQSVSSYQRIRGFYYDKTQVDSIAIASFGPLSVALPQSTSQKRAQNYVKKIHDICQENNIKLMAVRSPYPPSRLHQYPDDIAHDYFTHLYTSLAHRFIDFNYPAPRQLRDTDFSDNRHLNYKGARKLSIALAYEIQKTHLGK